MFHPLHTLALRLRQQAFHGIAGPPRPAMAQGPAAEGTAFAAKLPLRRALVFWPVPAFWAALSRASKQIPADTWANHRYRKGGPRRIRRKQANRGALNAIFSFACYAIYVNWRVTCLPCTDVQQHGSLTVLFMLAESLFILLGGVSVVGALGMLIARNPVTSALWLILTLFCVAGLFLTLGAEFIAVVQVLVYAGAIMVLFLFVIMLLNLGSLPLMDKMDWKKAVGFVLCVIVLTQLVFVASTGLQLLPEPTVVAADTGSATTIAKELFTRYALAFEMIGALLLVATVGAVMLAKRKFV